jgi:KUP system potassium uptake protein
VVLAVTGAEALYADMGHFGRSAITRAWLILGDPVKSISSPFFLLVPDWARIPRLRIANTSDETIGQIYVPWINWTLMVSVLTLVFAFQTSAALAFAFGMAVTGTITITTLLFFYLFRHKRGKPLWLVAMRPMSSATTSCTSTS